MASSRFAIFALAAIAIPTLSLAVDYIVGDDSGWNVGIDYQAWAAGKNFFVGDKLIFKYVVGNHNVYEASGSEFETCSVPKQGKPLSSGNDVIMLTTAGKKWYICGFGGHCEAGQKLVITVLPHFPFIPSPAPAPAPCS